MHRRSVLATLLVVNLVFASVFLVTPGTEVEVAGNVTLAPPPAVPELKDVVVVKQAEETTVELPNLECRIWGPQENKSSFATLQRKLKASGVRPQIFKTELSGGGDSLVLVRGLSSMAQARSVAEKLNALDIETYVMMRESEPVLSVGVFSQERLAQAQYLRMKELGYDASVEPFGRSREVFSLRAHVESGDPNYLSSVGPCTTLAQDS